MPTTYAIPNGRTVFDATTYTGTGSTLAVSNADNGTVGFKPDFVWIKERSQSQDHALFDSVRGATKQLSSNTTGAEATYANSMSAFNTNGFSVVSDAVVNSSGQTYVGWQWQAGQGTTSSNTNGSITSTVSVNASAGFSIVSYTGTQSAATIGHGLGVAPSMIIVRYTGASNWQVYHVSNGNTSTILLNSTAAVQSNIAFWNNTSPTSSVFSVGTSDETNHNGGTTVAYCWAEIAGFSKFGSYTGNGSTDGPFIYTGFRPKFILIKCTTDINQQWLLLDTSRSAYNVAQETLFPDSSGAEQNNPRLDFLSNGIKIRNTYGNQNTNGSGYIYAAFAENPTKFANAR